MSIVIAGLETNRLQAILELAIRPVRSSGETIAKAWGRFCRLEAQIEEFVIAVVDPQKDRSPV